MSTQHYRPPLSSPTDIAAADQAGRGTCVWFAAGTAWKPWTTRKARNLGERAMGDAPLRIGTGSPTWDHGPVGKGGGMGLRTSFPGHVNNQASGRQTQERGVQLSAGSHRPLPHNTTPLSSLHQPVKALDADLIGIGWCCRRHLVQALIRPPLISSPAQSSTIPPPVRRLPRRHFPNGKMASMLDPDFAHVGPLHRDQRSTRAGFLSGAVGVGHPCARWRSYLRAGGACGNPSWSWAGWVYSDGGIYLGYIARCIAMV
ncbi:hypothetical protein QBC39DRAFT_171411 [Podospora conica]|nr:hypothetical protein QBC39DRAFT_171411 [Schizothecium conicum]